MTRSPPPQTPPTPAEQVCRRLKEELEACMYVALFLAAIVGVGLLVKLATTNGAIAVF